MGHRHFFSSSYMLEPENDQSWNLTDHPYMNIARNGAGESSNLTYPADNMSIDGSQYPSHHNHSSMPALYSSLPHNLQIPNHQQDVPGPSHLHMHPSSSIHFHTTPENRNQPSSSSFTTNPFEEDLFDITVGNGRNQYKRKSPGVPDVNSSDTAMRETPNTNFLHAPWDYYHTGAENSLRNVRNRAEFDFERAHFSNNLSRNYYTTSRAMDVSPSIDLPGQISNSLIDPESNPFGNHSAPITRSSHASQNFQGVLGQSVRGVRSSFGQSQRPVSTFGASSSNSRVVHADERLQLAASNSSLRHSRPSGRARMSSERYRSFSDVNFRDRPTPEGLMIVDRTAFYGSRNPFDQHRDMRLDIDDMSYEELLALGERIGSVGTGLPEHLISKCVQESIFCSSDQIQDEGTCVICLEEYANMDDIGMLKGCRHDFHVGCIRKWLSMKNLCPICKAEPIKHK